MYCTDFAVWILTLLLKGQSKAYHVGGEEGLHLFEMANKIAAQYNLEVQSVCPISRDLHCKGVIPSTRRAFEEFGLTCEVDFMQALRKTVDWYRKAISAGCTVKSP
jgi:nucleoside-diphosphate-sugar epimerase